MMDRETNRHEPDVPPDRPEIEPEIEEEEPEDEDLDDEDIPAPAVGEPVQLEQERR
jgi:hypothetical protein